MKTFSQTLIRLNGVREKFLFHPRFSIGLAMKYRMTHASGIKCYLIIINYFEDLYMNMKIYKLKNVFETIRLRFRHHVRNISIFMLIDYGINTLSAELEYSSWTSGFLLCQQQYEHLEFRTICSPTHRCHSQLAMIEFNSRTEISIWLLEPVDSAIKLLCIASHMYGRHWKPRKSEGDSPSCCVRPLDISGQINWFLEILMLHKHYAKQ